MQRNLVSHCVLRPVSGREHHVSDDILAGIEGCGYKDQACFFVAYHDDSGRCGCSSNHGVYCGYNWQYGDCISYTVSMLWGDWRVCTFETLCLPLAKGVFRKPTFNSLFDPFGSPCRGQKPSLPLKKGVLKSSRPSLPLKKAPPFSPSLSSLRDERM